jgi:type II secretory pathway predicted ATPase ExeA
MDYVKFFGLEREPFQNDLDGRFYFEGAAQRRARMHLVRALQQHKGLALLLGGPGLGKTTLAHHVLRDLDARRFAAHLLLSSHRDCARGWFLPQVARVYGVAEPSPRVPELIEQIHERLLAVRGAGRHPVLFVDEAQLLGEPQTLEEFRALLNLAHEGQRVLSLLLFGMDELGGVMALDPSLAQRVDVRVQLCALSAEETGAYLAHRLACAGGDASLLSADAVEALYLYSGGVPRVLNTLADNALFEASIEECRPVAREHVAAAALQLDLRPLATEGEGARAVASFQRVSAEDASARVGPAMAEPPAPPIAQVQSSEVEPADDEPPIDEASSADEALFGENTAETLGTPTIDEDWLEPVAPVLDAVLRSFEEEPPAEDDARPTAEKRAQERPGDALREDPLQWSLGDLGAESSGLEPPAPPSAAERVPPQRHPEEDSLANLSFADEAGEEDVLDLGPALPPVAPAQRPAPPKAAPPARSRGPRIDLPEDDDLDSLFDEIQIDS